MSRLIPRTLLPDSLWDSKNSLLYLPPQLIASWKKLLEENTLLGKAMERGQEGSAGGRDKEGTDNHLAWRFTGSSARIMLPILDPFDELLDISDVLVRLFSGNKIFLVDLPCGSGAASMSILSLFCELRKQNRLPRMPLHIIVVGGDISKYAQNYAAEGLGLLVAELESQAITVEFDMIDWDVCDPFSNTDLIKYLTLKSQDCTAKLLMLANFSDFLQRSKKWDEAEKQIGELFRHSRDTNSIAVWIEPQTNEVVANNGFMSRLVKWFKKAFSALIYAADQEEEQKDFVVSQVTAEHPLTNARFPVRLSIVRFDLPMRRHS